MGKGFCAPRAHHAGQGGRVIWCPVHRAGLLFADFPIAFATPAIQIVMEGGEIRMALAHISLLDVVGI